METDCRIWSTYLFEPKGDLEYLILDCLGYPEGGLPVKGGWKNPRKAWVLAQSYILWSRYWNSNAGHVANNINQITVGGNNDLRVISQGLAYGL